MTKRPESRTRSARAAWHQIDALRLGTNWAEDDLDKLQVLVDDVFGDSHPGSVHLSGLSEEVSIGVWESAGKPSTFHVTDVCDGCAMGHSGMNYVLPSRELIADLTETHASFIPWDAMVLVSSCDKSIPAHLMAAARVNIPTVHLPGGSMSPGPEMSTSDKTTETSLLEKVGKITPEQIRRYKLTGCPSCGACQFMGTASTMQCMSEALGLALPGSALVPATGQEIRRCARCTGRLAIQLAKTGLTPRQVLMPAAFENAIKVHAAISGSTNALIHLPAIAHEAGIELDMALFDKANASIPLLASIQPSGRFVTELFWLAGGVPRVQWEIRDQLHLDALTVTGRTLRENLDALWHDGFFDRGQGFLANYRLQPEEVIRPAAKAESRGSVAILRGNLAPEGAVVKHAAVHPRMMRHVGRALVFDSEEAAHSALVQGKVAPGSVLIIRYEGPRGSGMPEMFMTTGALMAIPELATTTALVTDGRFSGGTKGPCIGHVSPEAAAAGPIALVQDGDLIQIDIPARKLNIVGAGGVEKGPDQVAALLAERRHRWQMPSLPAKHGVLKRYTDHAVSAMKGAYLP